MNAPNPQLQQFEAQLQQLSQNRNFQGALQVFAQMQQAGVLQPYHMIGKGQCHLQVGQQEEAKQAWIQGLQAQPNLEKATQLLDAHFPNWAQRSAPAPPPPPAGGGDEDLIRFDDPEEDAMPSPNAAFQSPTPAPAGFATPAAPQQQANPFADPGSGFGQPAPPQQQPAQGFQGTPAFGMPAAQQQPGSMMQDTGMYSGAPAQDSRFSGKVCWDYIIEDVQLCRTQGAFED